MSHEASGPHSLLCQPSLRDPLSHVWGMLVNPGPLRATCHFMVESYTHGCYLEAPQPCPYHHGKSALANAPGRSSTLLRVTEEAEVEEVRCVPVLWRRVDLFSTMRTTVEHLCIVDVADPTLEKFTLSPRLCVSQSLTVARLSSLRIMDNYTVRSWRQLREARFEDLPCLTGIGYWCLTDCAMLQTVVVQRLPELRSIGGGFLLDCPSLTSLTIADVPLLATVESGWLSGCHSLAEVHFVNFPSLKEIGSKFLFGCSSLQGATFESMPKLTQVGPSWMAGCGKLEKVRVAHLPMLGKLEYGFLDRVATQLEVGPECHQVFH